jgi:hypothetical protein
MTFPGSDWYRLDDKGEPVRIGDVNAYIVHTRKYGGEGKAAGLWGHPKQVVARTNVGNFKISTVFLFLDHNWDPRGKPVLWETLVFRCDKGKQHAENQKTRAKLGLPPRKPCGLDLYTGEEYFRCGGSREQAEAQHMKICRKVARREKIKPDALILELPA